MAKQALSHLDTHSPSWIVALTSYYTLLPCGTVWPEADLLSNPMNRKNGTFLSLYHRTLPRVSLKTLHPPGEDEISVRFPRFSPTLHVHGKCSGEHR